MNSPSDILKWYKKGNRIEQDLSNSFHYYNIKYTYYQYIFIKISKKKKAPTAELGTFFVKKSLFTTIWDYTTLKYISSVQLNKKLHYTQTSYVKKIPVCITEYTNREKRVNNTCHVIGKHMNTLSDYYYIISKKYIKCQV